MSAEKSEAGSGYRFYSSEYSHDVFMYLKILAKK